VWDLIDATPFFLNLVGRNSERELIMLTTAQKFEPYSLTVKDAAKYFGLAAQTFYNWINIGKLHRGIHYLKIGKKVVIVREKFIEWMEAQDGDLFEK
jgi:excisionase family DNA binding protein